MAVGELRETAPFGSFLSEESPCERWHGRGWRAAWYCPGPTCLPGLPRAADAPASASPSPPASPPSCFGMLSMHLLQISIPKHLELGTQLLGQHKLKTACALPAVLRAAAWHSLSAGLCLRPRTSCSCTWDLPSESAQPSNHAAPLHPPSTAGTPRTPGWAPADAYAGMQAPAGLLRACA